MDVKKIAKLAHLEITDEEVALYTPQMADIVAYVEQLNELDTEAVEPAIGGLTPEGEQTETNRAGCSARIARSKSRARRSTVSGRRTFSSSESIMNFKFQVPSSRFQVSVYRSKFLVFIIFFLQVIFTLSCSLPNLEKPECIESREIVKQFYSFHFGNDMKPNFENLKQRDKFLSPDYLKT